jgi:hypothetical protein
MKNTLNHFFLIIKLIYSYFLNAESNYKQDLEEIIHKINEVVLTKLHIFKSYNKYNKIHTSFAYIISILIMCIIDIPIALCINRPLDKINPGFLIVALLFITVISFCKTCSSIKLDQTSFFKAYPENIKFIKIQERKFMFVSLITINFMAIIAIKLIFMCAENPEHFNFALDPNVSINTTYNMFSLLVGVILAKYSTTILKVINETRWHSKII